MRLSLWCSCITLAAALAAASPELLAQHGGGRGGGYGGMGGGMGAGTSGGFGGGMSPAMQRGTAETAMPSERSSGLPGSERQSAERGARSPAELLQQNTKLADGLAKLLPAGTNLQSAASGFGNLGEFVAAVHVSSNLGIPFADLKTKLMAGDSLGKAINALRPGADGLIEARKARSQAGSDLAKG